MLTLATIIAVSLILFAIVLLIYAAVEGQPLAACCFAAIILSAVVFHYVGYQDAKTIVLEQLGFKQQRCVGNIYTSKSENRSVMIGEDGAQWMRDTFICPETK